MRGTVALTPAGQGTVNAEVRVDPRDGADDADWLAAIAWQGGGLVVDRLERTAPGVYRTTEPRAGDRRVEDDDPPAHGQRADRAAGLPARRPGDPGRGRPGRTAQFERPFGPEQQLLQRERKTDAPGWLWAVAYGVVLAIALGFLVAAGLGRAPRVGRAAAASGERFPSERERQPALRAT